MIVGRSTMNKEELLNSLARKRQVTKEATQLEKSLSKSLAVKQQAKKQCCAVNFVVNNQHHKCNNKQKNK